jgi:hypothetical protein
VFGAGPVLAPNQKLSWNACQQAKKSFNENHSLFRAGFLFLIDTGGLISVGQILSLVYFLALTPIAILMSAKPSFEFHRSSSVRF